jgi:hypothetical protein
MATRREFLKASALGTAGSILVPSFLLSGSPFDFLATAQGAESVTIDGRGPLGPLGAVVDYLTDPTHGLQRRLDFNRDPEGVRAVLPPKDMAKFLTFERGPVSLRVLEHISEAGFTSTDADAFADWLPRMARWSFQADEDDRHRIGLEPAGAGVQYAWPKCQVYRVEVERAGGSHTLRVYAQGLLKGASIRIVDDGSDDAVEEWPDVQVDQGSTFRYGRVSHTTSLAPGRYRAVVLNHLGDGVQFAIDTPSSTFEIV